MSDLVGTQIVDFLTAISEKILVWEQLASDHFNLWQAVSRQIHMYFQSYSHISVLSAILVLVPVGSLRITSMSHKKEKNVPTFYFPHATKNMLQC